MTDNVGQHFHWQCLLDQSSAITSSLTCPSCTSYLPTNQANITAGAASSASSSAAPPPATQIQIVTHYTNEGGTQPDLDIYPILREESFLASHPEARPARALHTLAAEGDIQGMVELIADLDSPPDTDTDDDNNSGSLTAPQLLVWRDPLNGGRSVLHVALEARQEEVVWLLLWLASGADRGDFPDAVAQVAQAMGLPRREVIPTGEDVRFVRDESGRTAADICMELGEPWTRLVEGGLFS